ncbi:alpha/beta fold hydrolase [Micromonospora sp. NPDC048170]|uniref:thioesterase II family protein n=1 Tax=Micromonospora sp. NPDC048170 TaxID=3154819 RepID=UPI00340553D7
MTAAIRPDPPPDGQPGDRHPREERAFRPVGRVTGDRPQLFCLPYAGGSANGYDGWLPLLSRTLDVWAAELPGRGTRFHLPPAGDVGELTGQLLDEIEPMLADQVVLFGHSMGATLALELALRLQARGAPLSCLVVSGQPAPGWPRDNRLHLLDDARLTVAMKAMGGTPPEVFDSAELLELMLPILRADLRMVENHRFTPGATVRCPLVAYGSVDDPDATAPAIAGWADLTEGAFESRMFPGDHFYFQQHPEAIAVDLTRRLLRHLSTPDGAILGGTQ